MMKVSAFSLTYDREHPFLMGFKTVFESPLSLSNNIEDDAKSDIYLHCTKTVNLLVNTLDKPRCLVILSAIKFETIVKTLVLIQETVLIEISDRLSKSILCDDCSPQCTFFNCKDKKVSQYKKRLADIGFHLFVFVMKARQVMGDDPLPRSNQILTLSSDVNYQGFLTQILKTIDRQIGHFQAYFEKVNKKMLSKNEPFKSIRKPKSDKSVRSKSPVNLSYSDDRRQVKRTSCNR